MDPRIQLIEGDITKLDVDAIVCDTADPSSLSEARGLFPHHLDTIVHVPADRLVFTGVLLFNEGHPIVWDGPIANWIAACDHILGLDVETVVPGHGPITDKGAVRRLKHYFEFVLAEARARMEAGMGWEDAANDIALDGFRGWGETERIVANVRAAYRDLGGETRGGAGGVFGAMQRYRRAHGH